MKRRNNRFLAGTLAGLMMLTMLPVTALAAEEGAADETTTLTTTDGTPVPGASDNGIENVVNDTGDSQDTGANADANDTGDANPIAGNDGAGENNTTDGENGTDESNPVGGENGTGESNPTGGETSAPVTPPAETFTAKIGNVKYDSLSKAVEAAKGGDTIEVGEDCSLDVGIIDKDIIFNGNGHKISIAEQTSSENHALNINAAVTFNNTELFVSNTSTNVNQWGITMNSSGVFTLDERSHCTIEKHGIYTTADAVINVLGNSTLTVRDTTYTAMMAEKYAVLNIENGSEVVVRDAYNNDGVPNGINNFKINVTNAYLKVLNCENQGLVRCWLTLDGSEAEISGNETGMTGYKNTDVLTMKNGSKLLMEDNGQAGIFLWGGNVDVQDGTTLTITGTGSKFTSATDSRYAGALAVYYYYSTYKANVNFADGAEVNLTDNHVSAINSDGEVYIGSGTTIMNNGSKALYGGGIQNRGQLTVADGARIYNNHATDAGDDIYNTTGEGMTPEKQTAIYTGSIKFAPTGDGWTLDGCNDPIVGWYQDGSEMLTDTARKRWNGDGEGDAYYAAEYTVDKKAVSDALALKAAHGKFCNVTYEVTGDIPSDAGAAPASAKVKMGGSYTVAPAQTTSQSRYTFSGWRIDGTGDIVTSLENLRQDVKLVGVWSYRSGGGSGGGGGRKPTVDIPDDVPTGLNGDDHFAYIVGYPDGNVKPGSSITRAEVATIFFRLLTEDVRTANSTQANSLSDVSRGQWFNHAISTLSSMGIVKGNPDGTFDSDAPITRAEFAAIAARFDDKNTNTTSNFSDIASHWAKDEIGVAANKGWINGYPDSTFRPDQYITRAEAMTLVNRVLNRLPEKSEDLLDDMIKWPDNADASVWYYLAVQEATNSHDYSDKSNADKYEKWTKIRDARDWTLLEK